MDASVLDFADDLEQRLQALRAQNLQRELRWLDSPPATRIRLGERSLLNFSSNDYLGLANDPELRERARAAIARYGTGSGASRLICGSLPVHRELEERLAAFKGTAAALTFTSGYTAALGTIPALVGRDDLILIDRLAHACLIDAARLSGARWRVFPHNDVSALEGLLRRFRRRPASALPSRARRCLILTESVFSMDGDWAPLRELVGVKERWGAWLMVDEAHATGLYGEGRRGRAEAEGVAEQIEIQMGTLSKAIGSTGGFICGARPLIDLLVHQARTFIFTTAPGPASAAAATAAVEFIQSQRGADRCRQLGERSNQLAQGLQALGLQSASEGADPGCLRAIIPVITGGETEALAAAQQLGRAGLYVPAIRYPAVAKGAARLRITLSASHDPADVAELLAALAHWGRAAGRR